MISSSNIPSQNTIDTTLELKRDFPLLLRYPDLSYLDTASSSQKPQCVLDALIYFYEAANANTHRGAYSLSAKASALLENARSKVSAYIKADSDQEIVFTRGTTESLNIIANSFVAPRLQKGQTILLGGAEHHANVVPWQVVANKSDCRIQYIPICDDGNLDLDAAKKLLNEKPALLSIAHVSNVLGTINPVKELTCIAATNSVPVVIDGAQAVGHLPIDVTDLNCDFYTFSGHKTYGPMGVGVLYAKEKHFAAMPPFLTGGGMIDEVLGDHSTYIEGPQKFEAGTQSVADAHALGAAIDYVNSIGINNIHQHEQSLIRYAETKLSEISELSLLGPAKNRPAPIFSFSIEGIHPHDIATVLDQKNVAVRAGHHCSQHTMNRFNVNATTRASFGLYTSTHDIDALATGLKAAIGLFSRRSN